MTKEEMLKRIKELEAIIREKNHTICDMYHNDLEVNWSKKSNELQYEYENKYKVDLEWEDDEYHL